MHSRPSHSKWQRFTLMVCLFALSVLAPMIWREVRSYRASHHDATAAKIVRDADRSLGLAPRWAADCEPEQADPVRLDSVLERPFDSLVAEPSEGAEAASLAALKEPLSGRVGQWQLAIEPFDAAASGKDEDLAKTPAPGVHDDVLQATQGEPLALESMRWSVPEQLIKDLQKLAGAAICRDWAAQTATLLESLAPAKLEETAGVLQKLRRQAATTDELLGRVQDARVATQIRRLRHALERRLDVWQGVHGLQRASAKYVARPYDFERLSAALRSAEQFVEESSDTSGWGKYLMLGELRELAGGDPSPTETAAVLHRAVGRFQARGLGPRQRRYLRSEPLADLKSELLRLLDEPVDTTRLLAMLEAYEAQARPSLAAEMGESLRRLSRSLRPDERQLANQLERHYRGPNLRLSLTQRLVGQVLPQQDLPQVRSVNDTIMGVPVSGQALSRNELHARLLPSTQDTLRVELQAYGRVDSDTTGRANSVMTFTQTQSHYLLSKIVEFRQDGVSPLPAQVEWVRADTQLNDLQTNWDGLPLFGGIARSMALSRYEETAAQRRSEVEGKVAQRALREFELQAAEGLSRLNVQYMKRVLTPLYRLELDPEVVTDPPSEDRLTMRFRLANEHHLGSHTPRPRALAGSLASLQVHESLVNNIIEQLDLGGRTLTGAELVRHLNAKFNVKLRFERAPAAKSPASKTPGADKPEPDPAERVQFTFAQQDAVRARLDGGRILLTVSLDQLEAGGRRWKNFQLVVPYEVRPVGRTAELVQVGETSIIGRISSRSQIVLRGIMTNVFDKDRTYRVLDSVMTNSRLADTRVVQVEIIDGWLGLSLGSTRPR